MQLYIFHNDVDDDDDNNNKLQKIYSRTFSSGKSYFFSPKYFWISKHVYISVYICRSVYSISLFLCAMGLVPEIKLD